MFKSKSYDVKKASKKNEKEQAKSSKSSSASGSMTLKKKEKIKSANNTKNHQNIDKKSIQKKPSQNGKKMTHLPLKMKRKKQ